MDTEKPALFYARAVTAEKKEALAVATETEPQPSPAHPHCVPRRLPPLLVLGNQ